MVYPAFPFTEAIGAAIVGRHAAGESLRSICGRDGVPCPKTVAKWARTYPAFGRRYREARQAFEKARSLRRGPQVIDFGLVNEICARLEWGETVKGLCRSPGLPTRKTLYRWLRVHPDFARRYRAALARKQALHGRLAWRYSDEIAAEICRRLAGGESLNAICGEARMPDAGTVNNWRARMASFDRRCREMVEGNPPPYRGRSGLYSAALASAICERLAAGETLKAICASPGMPSTVTVFDWLKQSPGLARRYAQAREEAEGRWDGAFLSAVRDPLATEGELRALVGAMRRARRGAGWKYEA